MQTSQFYNHGLKAIGFEVESDKVEDLLFEYWTLKRADIVVTVHKEFGDLKGDGSFDLINEYVEVSTQEAENNKLMGTRLPKIENFELLCVFLKFI